MRWVLTPARAALGGSPAHWFQPKGLCRLYRYSRDPANSVAAFWGWRVLCFALRHPQPSTVELPVSRYWARHSTQGYVLRRRNTELLYMRRTGDNG